MTDAPQRSPAAQRDTSGRLRTALLGLFLVLMVSGWFGYWFVYGPMQCVKSMQEAADDLRRAGQEDGAQWFEDEGSYTECLGTFVKRLTNEHLLALAIFGVPVVGYALLRLLVGRSRDGR